MKVRKKTNQISFLNTNVAAKKKKPKLNIKFTKKKVALDSLLAHSGVLPDPDAARKVFKMIGV